MLVSDIIDHIARTFNVTTDHLLGHRRDRYVMRARMAAYKVFHARGASLAQTGMRLDRDRTTVAHGLRQADELMKRDAVFRDKVQELISAQVKVRIEEPAHD